MVDRMAEHSAIEPSAAEKLWRVIGTLSYRDARMPEQIAVLQAALDAFAAEANTREVERRRSAEARAKALSEYWVEAQPWYRENEKTIRAAGILTAPDFMVPF